MFARLRIGIVILFLMGCTTMDPIEEAKHAQARQLRENCMNSVSNAERPNPILRTQVLQQCHFWSRRRAGL